MPDYPLNTSGSAVVDAGGTATVTLGPSVPGERWTLSVAAVRASSAVLEPVCRIYIGPTATDDFFTDGTYSGSQDSTDQVSAFPLTIGTKIIAKWSGADVGAVVTLSVMGTKTAGRQ